MDRYVQIYFIAMLVLIGLLLVLRLTMLKGFRALGAQNGRDGLFGGGLYYLSAAQLAAAEGAVGSNLAMVALPCVVDVEANGVRIRAASRNGLLLAPIELGTAAELRWFERNGLALGVPPLLRLSEQGQQHFLLAQQGLTPASRQILDALYARLARVLPNRRREASAHSNWRGAAVLVPLLGAAIAILLYGAWNRIALVGPQFAAVDAAGRLWLADEDGFVQLDERADAVAARYRFADFGIEKGIADWQFLADGRLLLGDFGSGKIRRCTLRPAHCEEFEPALPAAELAFKFHYDEANAALLFVDSDAHRAFRWQGGKREELHLDRWGLCHPNRITLDADGRALLADTNHHRLLHWRDGIAAAPHAIQTVASMPARSRCQGALGKSGARLKADAAGAFPNVDASSRYPTDFVQLGDRTAVLLNDDRLRRGDVVVLGDRKEPERLALEAGTDAWSLAPWQGGLLVLDALNGSVQQFDASGRRLADLAEAHLRPLREAGRKQRSQSTDLMVAGFALVGLMLAGAVAAGVLGRRQQLARLLRA